MAEVEIEKTWRDKLSEEFEKPYFTELTHFIKSELREKQIVYPKGERIFKAFQLCPFNKVKVVIIGQDPYHGPGQANGLSFSVNIGLKLPPSLRNIYKEIEQDLNISMPKNGDLSGWAQQGVLLLNATLTVRHRQAGSHQGKGWENFTDAAMRSLNEKENPVVFMLWGRFARQKKDLITNNKHLILEAAHPSPFSAHNGFFGCRHFSKANKFLEHQGLDPINWQSSKAF